MSPDLKRITYSERRSYIQQATGNALAALEGAREAIRAEAMRHKGPLDRKAVDAVAATVCMRPDDLHYAASVVLSFSGARQDAALSIAAAGLAGARRAVAA